jgi:hypothetical protein
MSFLTVRAVTLAAVLLAWVAAPLRSLGADETSRRGISTSGRGWGIEGQGE